MKSSIPNNETRSFVLEDWEIVSMSDPDGSLKLCLMGLAFGESLPMAGTSVRTSPIVRYRLEGTRLAIGTRSGSEYLLGLRESPQDEDKRRLVRYLDRISGARSKGHGSLASETQTDILGGRFRDWDGGEESAA